MIAAPRCRRRRRVASDHERRHNTLFPAVLEALRTKGADDVRVFGGGIIPDDDIPASKRQGRGVFTPGTSSAIIEWVARTWHPRRVTGLQLSRAPRLPILDLIVLAKKRS